MRQIQLKFGWFNVGEEGDMVHITYPMPVEHQKYFGELVTLTGRLVNVTVHSDRMIIYNLLLPNGELKEINEMRINMMSKVDLASREPSNYTAKPQPAQRSPYKRF